MTRDEIGSYVLKRYDKLYSDQANWRSLWQDLADFIHPRKSSGILNQRSPGVSQTDRLFDSTAIHANELLAASMNSAITSSAAKWFGLKVRGMENPDKAVTDWLEDCAEKMYRAFQQSNFNSEIHECYLDLGAFGTADLEVQESEVEVSGFNGLQFRANSIGEYVVDEDANGRVKTKIRKFTLSARDAFNKWGKNVEDGIEDKIDTPTEPDRDFLHGVFPSKELGRAGNLQSYVSVYVNCKTKKVVQMGGFRGFPDCVPRWAKSSGEKYGRGPGFTALPDIKTLNKAVELGLKAWAKALDPPLEVLDDGVIGSVRLQPSSINYVRQLNTIKPLEFNAKFDVSQIKSEDLKSSIRRVFFSDQLQFTETPQMTATEVYVRYELMQKLLGPTMGRLESELLNPLIERVFDIMFRAGAFLPPPIAIGQYEHIDIEYEGPMSRAMRSTEVIAIQRTLQIIAPFATANPEVLDWYDTDKIAQFAPTVTGMPSSLLRNQKEVDAIRAQRAQEVQAQKLQQTVANVAQAGGQIAPFITALKDTQQGQQQNQSQGK